MVQKFLLFKIDCIGNSVKVFPMEKIVAINLNYITSIARPETVTRDLGNFHFYSCSNISDERGFSIFS